LPAAHAAHTGGLVAVAAVVCSVPGAHAPCATQALWLAWFVYVPEAHEVHVRSFDAVPATLT
jgi:hypothetical protein